VDTSHPRVNVNQEFGVWTVTKPVGTVWQDVTTRMVVVLLGAPLGTRERCVLNRAPTSSSGQTVSTNVDIVLMIPPALLKMVFAQRGVIQVICFLTVYARLDLLGKNARKSVDIVRKGRPVRLWTALACLDVKRDGKSLTVIALWERTA